MHSAGGHDTRKEPSAAIKAVSFDADGTLWDFQQVMRHSLDKVLRELERLDPQAASLLTIDGMIATRNRVAEELKGSTANLETIRSEAFRQTLTEIGRPDDRLARHLNEVYFEHRFGDVKPYGDVLPTLTTLRQHYALGLLSNGNSYPERCGLDGMFRSVVFSQDHGVEKPDARLFDIALNELGCQPHELLHIGDSLENDVGGAHSAGISCVWLNRKGVANGTPFTPDHEIRSLSELPAILAALSIPRPAEPS